MNEAIHVLSVMQPYTDLILRGHKWAESRSWRTTHPGRLYVHASKVCTAEARMAGSRHRPAKALGYAHRRDSWLRGTG